MKAQYESYLHFCPLQRLHRDHSLIGVSRTPGTRWRLVRHLTIPKLSEKSQKCGERAHHVPHCGRRRFLASCWTLKARGCGLCGRFRSATWWTMWEKTGIGAPYKRVETHKLRSAETQPHLPIRPTPKSSFSSFSHRLHRWHSRTLSNTNPIDTQYAV